MTISKRDLFREWLIALGFAAIIVAIVGAGVAHADEEPAGVFFAKYGASPAAIRLLNTRASVAQQRHSGVAGMVATTAQRHGVPVSVALAIAQIESRMVCAARSSSGALGVMQVLPRTARSVGITGRLTDCGVGIEAGIRYLAMIVRAHGTGCAALALYNRGIYARPVCTGYGARAVRLARV